MHAAPGPFDAPAVALPRLAPPRGTEVRFWNCPACAYDLAGLPADGVCPECGRPYRSSRLHIHGWRHWYWVPTGPRAHARLLISATFLSFILAGIGHRALNQPVTPVSFVTAAVALLMPMAIYGWFLQSHAIRTAPRPTRVFLTPGAVEATGVWRDAAIPWSRFRSARIRRKARGYYALTLAAPWQKWLLRELLPWELGLWRIVVHFPASPRDAALIRRVARRAIAAA